MRRWAAAHAKLLAIALAGVVELAAYVVADPGALPSWVVTVAVVVNALAVYAAPKNRQQVTRDDLKRAVDYFGEAGREQHVRREQERPVSRRHDPRGTSFP